jgi:hypothetical protein
METKEYTVYKFNELSEEGKEKAIQNYCDINVDYEWWDGVYMDAENIGLKIVEFDLDYNRHADGHLTMSMLDVVGAIWREHGTGCGTYAVATEWNTEYRNRAASWLWDQRKAYPDERYDIDDFQDTGEYDDLERDFLRDLLEEYSVILQNECDYLTSEEAITETLVANDYDFTEEGKID